MPNPDVDWKQAPEGANAWQMWESQPAWLAVTIDRMVVTTMVDQFERSIEGLRHAELIGAAPLFGYEGTSAEESLTPMPPWGRKDPQEVIAGLSYEQLRALRIMAETPNQEGSAIAGAADCGWHELFELAKRGFTEAGIDRVKPFEVHPVITDRGRIVVAAGLHLIPSIAR